MSTLLFIALNAYIARNLIEHQLAPLQDPHAVRKGMIGPASYLAGAAAAWANSWPELAPPVRVPGSPRLPMRREPVCSAPMSAAVPPPTRDLVVVHSSDLHIDHDYTARLHGGDGTAGLAGVLRAARRAAADVVVLAGDTFDCHRLPSDLLDRTAAVIAAAELPVVLLPGNHDPAVPDAVYHHTALAEVANLHVLGVTHDEAVVFPALALEIWGRPHRDYGDMIPFERLRPRSTRWQIAVAHGHYVPVPDRTITLRPSWLIGDDELTATGADYVALGHWNRPVKVSAVAAYYSGSPEYAGTVNVVRLSGGCDVTVVRAELDIAREPSAVG